jgi:hypothetical protein
MTFLPLLSEPCAFDLLVYANKEVRVAIVLVRLCCGVSLLLRRVTLTVASHPSHNSDTPQHALCCSSTVHSL